MVKPLPLINTALDNNCGLTVGVEEVQDAYLHCGSDGRQQHSDEERPDDIPLSPALWCWGWGGWNGEEQACFLHTHEFILETIIVTFSFI